MLPYRKFGTSFAMLFTTILKIMEAEIKSLTKTIKQQSSEIKRLNRIIENIEKKQPVKNKDKYTFLQAVNLRCKEKRRVGGF